MTYDKDSASIIKTYIRRRAAERRKSEISASVQQHKHKVRKYK